MNTGKSGRQFFFNDVAKCPYFDDGRDSTLQYLVHDKGTMDRYHILLAQGYRRTGEIFYRTVCKGCSACRPLRIEVDRFMLSASQSRTLNRNRDICVDVKIEPVLTREKVSLYERYILSKHGDDKDNMPYDPLPALLALHSGYQRIIEVDYFISGRLIAVGIVDEAEDALSSNYFYYDTEFLFRRPGVFSILKEISLAASLGKRYYYLGFCIEENPKMSYKKYFRPNQIYKDKKWIEYLPNNEEL